MKSNEHASDDSSSKWDNWAPETTIGNCKIKVFHSGESPPRALALSAEPVNLTGLLGASIACFLPTRDASYVDVRPPISTYWSSRRRGPHACKYFSGPYPKLEVALLKALSDKEAISERRIAALHILISGHRNEFELRDEDNVPDLCKDDARFKELANQWISAQSRTLDGKTRIEAAKKHLAKADEWYQSLKTLAPLSATNAESESNQANLTQCAVYKAILDAAVACNGVPLFGEVREAFLQVGTSWDETKRNTPRERQQLHYRAFDTAIKKLGFSWLPRTWDPVK